MNGGSREEGGGRRRRRRRRRRREEEGGRVGERMAEKRVRWNVLSFVSMTVKVNGRAVRLRVGCVVSGFWRLKSCRLVRLSQGHERMGQLKKREREGEREREREGGGGREREGGGREKKRERRERGVGVGGGG